MLKNKKLLIWGSIAIVVIAAGLHIRLLDGLSGELFARTLGDTTRYAAGYTDKGFRQVRVGMSSGEVRGLIGDPLSESWVFKSDDCDLVFIRNGTVTPFISSECQGKGIRPGLPGAEVIRLLGSPPTGVVWLFSESASDSHYRQRVVEVQEGRVSRVFAEFYLD